MQPYVGELIALGTALSWTVTTLFFSAAARRMGSLSLNQARLLVAFALLSLYGLARRGLAFPSDASGEQWLWLTASGLVGFTFGDLCLFRAFILVGPRLAALMMSLWPPLAALAGWAILGEVLHGIEWLAMAVTLSGVVWVVLERQPATAALEKSAFVRGLALAFLGALGQAVGYVLAKPGKLGYDACAATQIRVLAGMAGFAAIFTFWGWWPRFREGLAHRRALTFAALGAATGPFLGVSLSLAALEYASAGVASTIMATVPVLILPFVMVLYKEKVSLRAAAGAAIAVAGVAILFLSKPAA